MFNSVIGDWAFRGFFSVKGIQYWWILWLSPNKSTSLFYEKEEYFTSAVWYMAWRWLVCPCLFSDALKTPSRDGYCRYMNGNSPQYKHNWQFLPHLPYYSWLLHTAKISQGRLKGNILSIIQNILQDGLGHWSLSPAELLLSCLLCYFAKCFVPIDSLILEVWIWFFAS